MKWNGEDVFLWSEASLVITLKECVHNLCGVTVVGMIVLMEVNL